MRHKDLYLEYIPNKTRVFLHNLRVHRTKNLGECG